MLVVEEKIYDPKNHGEIVSAIAEKVATNLLGIKTQVSYIDETIYPDIDKQLLTLFADPLISTVNNSTTFDDVYLCINNRNTSIRDFWNNADTFIINGTGNSGDEGGNQPHNIAFHYGKYSMSVGLAMEGDRQFYVLGVSSANSPDILTTRKEEALFDLNDDGEMIAVTGTSYATASISGAMKSLDEKYGKYLTKEHIMFAVFATAEEVAIALPPTLLEREKMILKEVQDLPEKAKLFENQISGASDEEKEKTIATIERELFGKVTDADITKLEYEKNTAGHSYNSSHAGFGIIDIDKADKLLAHMVEYLQTHPDALTSSKQDTQIIIPTKHEIDDGNYYYAIEIEEDFINTKFSIEMVFGADKISGDVMLQSPHPTDIQLRPSREPAIDVEENVVGATEYGIASTHGFVGERTKGTWYLFSSQPIKHLEVTTSGVGKGDLIEIFDKQKIDEVLSRPDPDLSNVQVMGRVEQASALDPYLNHAA